jgi:hypothetical protein
VALGGPDTATRRQVVWRVRALEFLPPVGTSHRFASLGVATVISGHAPTLEACVPKQTPRAK